MTRLPQASGQRAMPPQLTKLRSYLIEQVSHALEGSPPSPSQRGAFIEQALKDAYQQSKANLPATLQKQFLREILNEISGYGPIQPLLDDEQISEIMVNNASSVYIERNGKLTKTKITFDDDEHVKRIINKIVLPLGRRIDYDNPTVDARLPDGSRVNAVIRPVALDGANITIRKFKKEKLGIEKLIEFGSITHNMSEFLKACVVSRLNTVISGGTGSGKTTLLNVLSGYIPDDERIVTIEDTAELQLRQDHVVRLETKPANIEGLHAVSIRDLVRNALRMRPDRIVIGEVRGGEALDMLQAMNTGHDGSLTTLHANTPRDALSRLETMSLMSGLDLPLSVIREQIASAVDLIVQQSRLKDGSRKVTYITEVSGMEGNTIIMSDIFKFEQTGTSPEGKIIGELRPTGIRPMFMHRLKAAGFDLPPEIFGANISDVMSRRRRR